jgi:1-acyl-sn-glycerol-3-phosphate acyltransferase
MKASKLRTLWIMLLSALFTANTCGRAMVKQLFGTISRTWCDEELQRWTKHMNKLLGIQCKIVNPHNVSPIPGQPTIVMVNHSSLFDIPLSLMAFPKCSLRMLAKKELSKIPIMGQGMKAAEFPTVDRHNRQAAVRNLHEVHRLLEDGIVMWIAPEGTRSKTGKVAPFKKGGFITAIQAKATIIPIGIRGAYNILPAKTFQFNINQKASIHIGQPIDAAKFTLENKEALIEQTYQSIKDLVEG